MRRDQPGSSGSSESESSESEASEISSGVPGVRAAVQQLHSAEGQEAEKSDVIADRDAVGGFRVLIHNAPPLQGQKVARAQQTIVHLEALDVGCTKRASDHL